MKRRACVLVASAVLCLAANTSWAQVSIQPAAAPLVTADSETWYLTGEPIAFAGSLYYPAGAALHFLPNEMVRTGFFRGVPLYSRTTIEPYSKVFVPLGGGMMQPYERRRDLDLAGTQGSAAPALSPALSPSVGATTSASPLGAPSPAIAQAPAPPMIGTTPVIVDEPVAPAAPAQPATAAPQPVGTAGAVAPAAPRRPMRIRRDAANAIYVEFRNARWYAAGSPVSLDARSLTQVGEVRGFPVYAARAGDPTIYIPIAQGSSAMASYSRRK